MLSGNSQTFSFRSAARWHPHQRHKLCQARDDVQGQEHKEQCAPEEGDPQCFCVLDCGIEGRALQASVLYRLHSWKTQSSIA